MIALIENLQREDLNFIEEAEGFNNLIVDHGFTQAELAENWKVPIYYCKQIEIVKIARGYTKEFSRVWIN